MDCIYRYNSINTLVFKFILIQPNILHFPYINIFKMPISFQVFKT